MINRNELTHNWNIICEVDLLHYGHSPDNLLALLKKHHKPNFGPNDKIFVRHEDTDYFYLDQPIGFSVYNLMRCWEKAKLPWHVMVFVSQMYDYGRAIKKHWKFHKNDMPTFLSPMVCEYAYENSVKTWLPSDNDYDIQYQAIALLGKPRAHRIALYKFLKQNNLFDKVATNYNVTDYDKVQGYTPKTPELEPYNTINPILDSVSARTSNINESLFLSAQYPEINEINQVRLDVHRTDPKLKGDFKNFYKESLVDIVCETMFASPHTYISEKLLRPIFYGKPFILLGPPHTLSFLHAHGIKTFDAWWDEDYDYETDHQLRFIKCCRIIERISGLTVKQCKQILEEMRPTLKHNQQVLTHYIDTTYTKLYKEKLCLK